MALPSVRTISNEAKPGVTTRNWALATIVTGVLTLALFVVFALLPEVRAAGECLAPGAVVQFELARNAGDLVSIFGPSGSTCRTLGAAAMDAVNHVDMLAFIPLYTAFCICAALYVGRGEWGRPLVVAAVAAAILAALADMLETTTLLDITRTLDEPGDLLARSQFGAWTKFSLLAAHALFCAGLCLTGDKRRWILGLALLPAVLGVAAAASSPMTLASVMTATLGLAWIALLVFAIRDVVRAKDAPA